jgi:hypothetical protein
MENGEFSPEVCRLRHDAQDVKIRALDEKINAVADRVDGLKDGIDEVRRLQTQILYAIIGLCGTSILILIGVIAGRAIDFGVFFG